MGAQDWWSKTQFLFSRGKQQYVSFQNWFSVDEQEIAKILEQVRQELPTTEVLLLGKPQTGKSSIIRSLTGVSADIIGQGFQPHTSHTQFYFFPTEDLPLLKFIDTIGLGEQSQLSSVILQEFEQLLDESRLDDASAKSAAKVIIVTVKAKDFATDFLYTILESIRADYPDIPRLLAITCLHELYPPQLSNHPPYPPTSEKLDRAIAELSHTFEGLCDRIIPIDFTLEEDDYTPVFYGLEALVNSLSELLPTAEANMIHQLLETSSGEQLGQLYRDAGRRYILPFSVIAATLAAVPLPFATMPVLTALQVTLVSVLGKLYGQQLTLSQAGGVVSAIAGGFLAQTIGRELIKFVPGVGSVIAASWAGAYTWALGEGACLYFGDLMGGKTPDTKQIQAAMNQTFKHGQQRLRRMAAQGKKPQP